uniref:Uncharacterized protein n=1 Tax=Glossina palpalis gambiensis TaxID=67801 RepID=A0A1B0B2I4_9MUSC
MFPEVSDDVSAVEMPPFCCCVAGCGSVLQLLTTFPAKLSEPSPLTIPPVIIPPATPPLLLFVCSEPFDCPPSRGIVQLPEKHLRRHQLKRNFAWVPIKMSQDIIRNTLGHWVVLLTNYYFIQWDGKFPALSPSNDGLNNKTKE